MSTTNQLVHKKVIMSDMSLEVKPADKVARASLTIKHSCRKPTVCNSA